MSLSMDVTKDFGEFQMHIQLETNGGVTGLLGGSGSGKSMTLKCVAGIVTPDAGQIVLNGETLFDSQKGINLPPQKRHVGYLFQNYALFPNMTVRQNLLAGARRHENRAEAERRMQIGMGQFALEGLEERLPSQLSGGQQQRVALLRMLISNPRILMLDEPFSALDSYLRWQLERTIAQVTAEFDGTTLFVSHDRDEVYRLCDHIAIIEAGRVEQAATRNEVFDTPKTLAAAMLTGCKNIEKIGRREADGTVYLPAWNLTLRAEGAEGAAAQAVGIRSHAFDFTTQTGENTFACVLEERIESPFSEILMVRPQGASALLRWEIDKPRAPRLAVGESLRLGIAPQQVVPLC